MMAIETAAATMLIVADNVQIALSYQFEGAIDEFLNNRVRECLRVNAI